MPNQPNHNRERGAALLLIVMTCVLGSIIVAAMLVRQHANAEQAERYFAFVQANQYAMGAELLARQLLYDTTAANNANAPNTPNTATPAANTPDAANNPGVPNTPNTVNPAANPAAPNIPAPNTPAANLPVPATNTPTTPNNVDDSDNLQQEWNTPKIKFEDEQLTISMSIEDLQGRFNLNSLSGTSTAAQADTFKRLLAALDITPAIDIVKSLSSPATPGATPAPAPPANPSAPPTDSPAPPANTLADPTQLLEQALPADDYEKLRPFITALPPDSATINVNTASETLLKAAIQDDAKLHFIMDHRSEKQPIASTDLQQAGLTTNMGVDVKSNFFQADITVTYLGRHYTWRSIIHRDKSQNNAISVETIARAFNREDNILK